MSETPASTVDPRTTAVQTAIRDHVPGVGGVSLAAAEAVLRAIDGSPEPRQRKDRWENAGCLLALAVATGLSALILVAAGLCVAWLWTAVLG
ncbi:hypothetical protein BJF83_20945 [Nocardiopsis sp. CNR-923]|uniref:hypothetical protein n=1 Tax=Nocardiopsis sp. CNR-923 TaxID=1904965 RepID=UPI000968C68E|nr:hypothetical protein [Nocardiopsis sp. CNR-923]OLT26555.1 hypothetical protein BJF83_20945 [Nocardiopsis sp. CNR-923]